jgi:hypothetical protein
VTYIASAIGHLLVNVVIAKDFVHWKRQHEVRYLGVQLDYDTFAEDTRDVVMDVNNLKRY